MLQLLLSQRLKLKIHAESRQVPVYALSVAKGGPKFQPTKEGSCVPFDTSLAPPYPQFCGQPKRGHVGLHLIGATMSDLCKILSAPEISDRPVIDKTGLRWNVRCATPHNRRTSRSFRRRYGSQSGSRSGRTGR